MQSLFTLWSYFSILKYVTYKYLESCDKFLDTGDMTVLINFFIIEFEYNYSLPEYDFKNLIKNTRKVDNNIILKNIDYDELNKKIFDFTSCLKEKMNEENYKILINTLSNNLINSYEIRSIISKYKLLINGIMGTVDYDNEKELFKYFLGPNFKSMQECVPFHEIFHLSSIYKEKGKKSFCGFSLPNGFGRMLNEGYTEHLTRKYFLNNSNDIKTASLTYYIAENISSILEKIIGYEEMEKCYLNADLNGLIHLMNKYISNEESCDFIYNLDLISNDHITQFLLKSTELYCNQRIDLSVIFNKVMNKYEYKLYNIEKTLIKMFITKMSEVTNLSRDMIISKTIDFYNDNFLGLKNITSMYKINKQLSFITKDEMVEIVDNVVGKSKKYSLSI